MARRRARRLRSREELLYTRGSALRSPGRPREALQRGDRLEPSSPARHGPSRARPEFPAPEAEAWPSGVRRNEDARRGQQELAGTPPGKVRRLFPAQRSGDPTLPRRPRRGSRRKVCELERLLGGPLPAGAIQSFLPGSAAAGLPRRKGASPGSSELPTEPRERSGGAWTGGRAPPSRRKDSRGWSAPSTGPRR